MKSSTFEFGWIVTIQARIINPIQSHPIRYDTIQYKQNTKEFNLTKCIFFSRIFIPFIISQISSFYSGSWLTLLITSDSRLQHSFHFSLAFFDSRKVCIAAYNKNNNNENLPPRWFCVEYFSSGLIYIFINKIFALLIYIYEWWRTNCLLWHTNVFFWHTN